VPAGATQFNPDPLYARAAELDIVPNPRERPLWKCKKCGRTFANRNQSHACGRYSLEPHFANKPPAIRQLYDAVVRAIDACGPVEVLPEKTRIAFHVRMSFAQLTPKRGWIDGHLVLGRRVEAPRFRKIEEFSPRCYVHHFRLLDRRDVDAQFRGWLKEAYAVGEQRHLDSARAHN